MLSINPIFFTESSSKFSYSEKLKKQTISLNGHKENYAPLKLQNYKANFLSFKGLYSPTQYNPLYAEGIGHNGLYPDSFIIEKLKQYCPIRPDRSDIAEVLDIGAGDGRNSLPIVQDGYHVTAVESSDVGTKLIKEEAERINKQNNINILTSDIFTLGQEKSNINKYDFTLMSHVTQHFTEEELDKCFENVSTILKPGGVAVFDALVRRKDYVPLYYDFDPECDGFANFNPSTIIDKAKKHGLELVESPTDYNESKSARAPYVDTCYWGRDFYNDEKNLKVDLKWFILRKKEV